MAYQKHWDDLSPQTRVLIARKNPTDPRIPPNWSPNSPQEKADRLRQREERKEDDTSRQRRATVYSNPSCVILDINSININLSETELWQMLELSWTRQGISPIRVSFRAGSRILITVDNPVLKTGKLPEPVTF